MVKKINTTISKKINFEKMTGICSFFSQNQELSENMSAAMYPKSELKTF